VGRREDVVAIAGEEVRAGGAAGAGRQQAWLARGVGRHLHDLIALDAGPGGLEDQAIASEGPVGLGVLAAGGELGQRAQVGLARIAQVGRAGRLVGGRRRPGGGLGRRRGRAAGGQRERQAAGQGGTEHGGDYSRQPAE
jgi:hypothetical protein